MRFQRSLTVLAALAVAVAGCSDDDDGGGDASADEEAFVDEAMESFDAEAASPLTEDDGRCIVTAMVDAVGVERLEEVDVSPASFTEGDFPTAFTEGEAEAIVDGIGGCVDLRALFLRSMNEDPALSDQSKECLAGEFDEALVDQLFVSMMTEVETPTNEQTPLMKAMTEAFLACPV
jgi:hypothetical protein